MVVVHVGEKGSRSAYEVRCEESAFIPIPKDQEQDIDSASPPPASYSPLQPQLENVVGSNNGKQPNRCHSFLFPMVLLSMEIYCGCRPLHSFLKMHIIVVVW